MNVPKPAPRGTRVRLPPDVARPFEIYVNGVPQNEGRDFAIEGRTLVFDRELKAEGKLGIWRWLSMWIGVAGTYRQNDSVDVVYQRNGKRVVASKLPLEPWPGSIRRARDHRPLVAMLSRLVVVWQCARHCAFLEGRIVFGDFGAVNAGIVWSTSERI